MGHQRLGSPEGMRADNSSRRTRHAGPIAALAVIAALCSVAIGDETAILTVTNHTAHRVDVVVANQTYPNIAPGKDATYSSSAATTVSVTVAYAPGQGVDGSAQRSFQLEPYHAASVSSSGYGFYLACSSGGRIVSPAYGGPMHWSVTADTLTTR